MNIFLIFCSGFILAVGGVNFYIGIFSKSDRSYLFFGLLSLFASLFMMIHFSSPQIIHESIISFVTILLACLFYGCFLWFVSEYTGFKKQIYKYVITGLVVITYVSYHFAFYQYISFITWEIIAHTTILCISIFGLWAGLSRTGNPGEITNYLFVFLMILLIVSTIYYGVGTVIGYEMIFHPPGSLTPLDYFPVFFSILIGSKMSHDVFRSYQLEQEVQQKEKEWSNLMETINLLIVRLDCNGHIMWVNSFFEQFTDYREAEILGKNWFDLMLDESESEEVQKIFRSFVEKGETLAYNNNIKIKNHEIKNIQWSNILLNDADNNCIGVLSIGADVSQLETAYQEIKVLKDQLEKENLLLKEEVKTIGHSSEIIGDSDALRYVLKRAQQVSTTDSTVLLEGETGVGKDLFANMIHKNSTRRHKPFVKVNCASLPKELIESELFGHEKGAFTGALKTRQGRFELADTGTLFLDEIGELPLELQPKLLRVLQSGEFERIGSEKTKKVNVRVIAATNRDLQEEASNGRFRQDLFFRLNVYPITIPPLRQRIEDIPMLIKHFTVKIGRRINKKVKQISKADISRLQAYHWPGNVRELENVLERAIISSESETIKLDEAQLNSKISMPSNSNNGQPVHTASLEATQKSHIVAILKTCQWKINGENGAAERLGMPPSTLRSKMKKLKITRPE